MNHADSQWFCPWYYNATPFSPTAEEKALPKRQKLHGRIDQAVHHVVCVAGDRVSLKPCQGFLVCHKTAASWGIEFSWVKLHLHPKLLC